MKLYIHLIALLITSVMWSCTSSEDPIHVDAETYKRVAKYDTLSTNYTLKYISKYYYHFDKIMITDPDSSDYWYNFSSSYKTAVGIDAPDDATAEIGVKMLDYLLVKWYDASFIKNHFPKSILIGKNVYNYTYNSSTQSYLKLQTDMYSGAYFLLIKAQNIDTMSVTTKKSVALKLNNILWSNIVKFRPFMNIDLNFYAYGKDNKLYESSQTGNEWTGGKTYDATQFVTNQKMYSSGFLSCVKEYGTYFGKPYITKVILPNESDDLNSWITFLLTTSDADIQALKTKYGLSGTAANPTVFEIKFQQIVKAFTDAGLDYRNLGYKPTL